MKKLIALMLTALILLAGCGKTAPSGNAPQAGGDNTMPEAPDNGSSGNTVSPPEDSGSDVKDPVQDPDNTQPAGDTPTLADPGADDPATPPPDNPLPPPSSASDIPKVLTVSDYLGKEYADTTQVILVTVKNTDATAAIVSTLEKSNGKWVSDIMTIGYVGAKGTAPGEDRKQSTLTTPMGIYRITDAMGISPDPGCLFPYTRVTDGMYWDLNSGSPTYNRLVYSDPGGDREVLSKMGKQYDYILNTSYNEDQVPDKGGAIFIHVSKNEPTAGCVSLPRSDMEKIMKWVNPAKKPVVIICLSADAPVVK